MNPEPWWRSKELIGLIGPLLGVVLGFGLGWVSDRFTQRRRRKAHWAALRAEIDYCNRTATTYVERQVKVKSPLYRLPTMAYTKSFPALLADGVLNKKETSVLIEFFTQVETLNRGLDQAESARGDEERLNEEYCRNCMKAKGIARNGDLYRRARAIVDAYL